MSSPNLSQVVARINKPSSSSVSPCTISQSIIVILVPFSNLNRTFAMGILFRSIIGLLTTTSMGIPTLSLQVNHNLPLKNLLPDLYSRSISCGFENHVVVVDHSDANMPCYYQRPGDSTSCVLMVEYCK